MVTRTATGRTPIPGNRRLFATEITLGTYRGRPLDERALCCVRKVMNVADFLELPFDFDPEPLQASARRLTLELRSDATGLTAALLQHSALESRAAALTLYLLGGSTRRRVDDVVRGLHAVALFALATETHKDLLLRSSEAGAEPLEHDLETLPAIARGEPVEPAGDLGRYIASLRSRLESLPGWTTGGGYFVSALLGLLDGLTQEYRMRSQARTESLGSTWAGSVSGSALELLIETTCIALGDKTRRTHDPGANFVSRLSAGLIGLAADLSSYERGQPCPQATERISQRFAIPAHVIRLDSKELRRALRATLALEMRDLLEATRYLPAEEPRSVVVRRAVAATLARQHTASAVLSALDDHHPVSSRAEVMGQMRRVAASKGQVTEDERELLRKMDTHLFGFQSLLDRIDHDRTVDFDEFQALRGQRQQILDDLFRTSLADDQITHDERQLLLKAMEVLPHLRGSL